MKKFLFLLIIFTCSFMITSKNVYADSSIIFPISEPFVDDSSSYFILYVRDKSTNKIYGRLHYFDIHVTSRTSTAIDRHPFVEVAVGKTSVDFSMNCGAGVVAVANYYYYWSGTNTYGNAFYSFENYKVINWTPTNYEILGYSYKGDFVVYDYIGAGSFGYAPIFAEDNAEFNLLTTLLSALAEQAYRDDRLYDLLYNTYLTEVNSNEVMFQLLQLTEQYLPELYNLISIYIPSIDSELNEIDRNLEDIITIIENFVLDDEAGQGEEVDKSSTQSQKDKESALLNKGSAVSNTSNVNVQLDSTANGTIWSIAESFINSNALIMGFFISMLSLGVVRLILNR